MGRLNASVCGNDRIRASRMISVGSPFPTRSSSNRVTVFRYSRPVTRLKVNRSGTRCERIR